MPLNKRPPRIRRWIFAFMFAVGFLAYLQQKSLTVAADLMEPELGFSQLQIGWLRTSFILAYALFQFPAGLIGQHFGARRTFVYAGILAIVAVLLMPAAPLFLSGTPMFLAMVASQFLLGVSQAFVWPVSAGVISRWFPSSRWPMVIGLQTMGLALGAMVAPPLISSLMVRFGWQIAVALSAAPAVPFVILWGWFGRNTPQEHPRVTPEELAELDPVVAPDAARDRGQTLASELRALLANRAVVVLAASYLCMNYVFYLLGDWVFLYLRQVRHFSITDSGWLASLPPLAAAVGAGIGGAITTALCLRLGVRWGFRIVPLVALPASGLLLLVAISASSPLLAIVALTAAYGSLELTEGSFWGATMSVGGRNTMAATGILNTGGNLGGVVSTPIIGYLTGLGQWYAAFVIGVGFAIVSALAWLLVVGKAPAERPE